MLQSVKPKRNFTQKGQQTRACIIEAAATLMVKYGVSGTSVDDVWRESKITASQLYHYFDDKQELLSAVSVYQLKKVL